MGGVPNALLLQAETGVAGYCDMWEVIGGSTYGGIPVRLGKEPSSPPAAQRLATGALVLALEQDDRRLHFELLHGKGPSSGWVDTRVRAQEMLRKVSNTGMAAKCGLTWQSYSPPVASIGSEDAS